MVEELSTERKLSVVQNKVEVWRNTLYDAQLDAEVAELTQDDNLRQTAQQRVKQALQALQLLAGKAVELSETPEADQ